MAAPRGSKVVSHSAKKARAALVANLRNAIAREYRNVAPTAAYEEIQRATGISLSTMQRIMQGRVGPSIDTLADLARHLGVEVQDLLTERSDPFRGDLSAARNRE